MKTTIARRLEDIDLILDKNALTGDNFHDYYVHTKAGRQVDPAVSTAKKLKTQKNKNLKILFTGYNGAGKSTELVRLQKDLEKDFLIIRFSAREILLHDTTFAGFLIHLYFKIRDPDRVMSSNEFIDLKERKSISELNNSISRIIKARLNKTDKQNILLIIDDLEKVPLITVDEIFSNYSRYLNELPCHLVFTFPTSLYFSSRYRNILSEFDRHYFLPMITVFDKAGNQYKPGIDCMVDIVYKRLANELVSERLLKKFIGMSGGVLRDLFQLLKLAADSALERGGKKIGNQDFLYSLNRLKNDYLNAISYNRETGLSTEDYYRLLADCYNRRDKTPPDVKGMADLKQNNLLLGYGAETWFDVHPAVKEILKDKELIEDAHPDLLTPESFTFRGALEVWELREESREYPPISLKRLTLHNIKCFKDVTLSFTQNGHPRPWSLLVGDNGMGKTTILHCIALCSLGPELASKIVPMPWYMLRVGEEKGYMEAVFHAPLQPEPPTGSSDDVKVRLDIEKGSRTFAVDMKGAKNNAKQLKRFIDARKRTDFEGWFAAGYGAVRNLLFTDEPFKIAQQDPVIDRVESLFDPTKLLIDPASLYRFLSGDTSPFKEMGAPPKLNTETIRHIRELLDKLLPMISLKDPNGQGNLETPFGKVPISELGEGYKSMLSWLAHLIMHLLAAVNWRGDIQDIRGIVLIDEVDLHLHPSWQQQVIPLLRECFPNLQFIGCTHSPMTAGGVDDGDIILLDYHEGEINARQDLPSIKGWRADQILTGPLFGLESTRDLSTQQKLDQYTRLLESPDLSPQQKKKLRELETELENIILPSGETETQREAFRMIEETMQSYLDKQPPDKKKQLLNEIKRQLKH